MNGAIIWALAVWFLGVLAHCVFALHLTNEAWVNDYLDDPFVKKVKDTAVVHFGLYVIACLMIGGAV